ncbi:MAG: M4 family metallopeptidase, partial [Bacteroidota bacterium]
YMIDASRPQYDATKSNLPGNGTGIIATLDAQNKKPSFLFGHSTIDVTYIDENNNNWSRAAVSAHYNSSLVYEYFKNTFNRNSIDGSGGNMLSIVNVVDDDGSQMDNAFFNDGNMYYGNGSQAFEPLAKALDVAGHEITHGVVQYTANLVYLSQPGALNESFADIFGALIDRDDWQIGENVTRTQYIASGALRDLSNPNNGANRGEPGWQPAHMDEYVELPETREGDNGGVHINSGIVNKAFHLFATAIGRDKAEQIYYKALRDYLTRSSQFVDCRLAVIQAATDRHGANSPEVTAAIDAFNGVGIFGADSGTPTDYQEDVDINPGEDFILLTDESQSQVYLDNYAEAGNIPTISETDPLSKFSVTDDGSFAVYVAADKTMKGIEFDWSSTPVGINEYDVSPETIWRNAAISKDGNRLAALTEDGENKVFVYDFITAEWQTFELENPSTAQGINNSNVQYADVLEWDFSGEFLLYDAENKITREDGQDLVYWDIGFLRVWNNNANDFGDGLVLKLVPDLAENTSIGNPTFSKNSPYIIAFDFLDDEGNNFILGANVETGDFGTIFENTVIGYPNFSRLDDKMLFDAQNTEDAQVLAIIDLEADKINGKAGSAAVHITGGKWGVWFAPGDRELTSSTNNLLDNRVLLYPNPFTDQLTIEVERKDQQQLSLRLFNLIGQEVMHQQINEDIIRLSANELPAGSYWLQITDGERSSTHKVIRL